MNSIVKMPAQQFSWQVQEAKNRFSEVIEHALTHGPQVVTRHGKPVVHVVSVADAGASAHVQDDGFAEYLMSAPKPTSQPDHTLEAPPRRSRRTPERLG